mgnify:CR=1 FL=1
MSIRKGVDAVGQPYTMIKDRGGTRYEYPEGENCWSRFKNPNTIGGLGICKDCDNNEVVQVRGEVNRCIEHYNLFIHMQNVKL